jgi:hypothetical protein
MDDPHHIDRLGEVTIMGMTSIIFYYFTGVGMRSFLVGMLNDVSFPQWLFTNAALASLLPAILVVGGFIVLTLSYVSYRKYRGEKEQKRKKRDKLVD